MSDAKISKSLFDTRLKCIIGVIGALVLAYITGSVAIDTGSWWAYFATMGLLLIGAKLGFRAIKRKPANG